MSIFLVSDNNLILQVSFATSNNATQINNGKSALHTTGWGPGAISLVKITGLTPGDKIDKVAINVFAAAGNVRYDVYQDDGIGGGPSTLLAESNSFPATAGITYNLLNTQAIIPPSGNVWVGFEPDASALDAYYTLTTSGAHVWDLHTFGPAPNPFVISSSNQYEFWVGVEEIPSGGPTISFMPSSGNFGEKVFVSGKGFIGNSAITITFDNSNISISPTITTNRGQFLASFVIPSYNPGNYAITVTDGYANTAQAPFAVASPNFFKDSTIVSGLNLPTAMEVAPDGRVFISEKAGNLRVVLQNGTLLSTPFLTVPVDTTGERGLLGIVFDPNFNSNGYIYVYYTSPTPTIHNVLSRFTASSYNPNVAAANTKLDILSLETLGPAIHNGGALHFGNDGKLYVSVGNNAINPNTPSSLSTHLGKVLRINSDGTIPSDNPFFNTPGAVKEIWALGLRNPFTFAFQPGTGKMYINDVGENTWEEIDNGTAGANYGWPTCEGFCSVPGMTNPIYTYNHNQAGAAITGGAFYEGTQFPAEYRDNYFFGDYVTGFIKRLIPSIPPQAVNFLTTSGPVDIRVGQDGSLYYISLTKGELHKVQYITTGNHDPTAFINVNKTSGLAPLAVSFNATGSSDAENDPMTFSWDFGDGSTIQNGNSTTHTYTKDGPYTAKLSASDGKGGVGTATVQINVGNPPTGTITIPINQTKYDAGDIIFFNATGTDPEDGVLPASSFYWNIVFHHNTHTHPFLEFTGMKGGNFTIPNLGETNDNVWYAVNLKVTDSSGLTDQKLVNIFPNKSNMTFVTNPSGLQITVDGIPYTTPTSIIGVVGMTRTLGAPTPQVMGGTTYNFNSWSDGLTTIHDILTPATNNTYTATYGP